MISECSIRKIVIDAFKQSEQQEQTPETLANAVADAIWNVINSDEFMDHIDHELASRLR